MKTKAQKKLEGTYRKDRDNMASSIDYIPEPSVNLPKEAVPFYNAIARHLIDNKVMQKADSFIIEAAANIFYMASETRKNVGSDPKKWVAEYGNKTMGPAPIVKLFLDLDKRLDSYFMQLGIGPKARNLMKDVFSSDQEEVHDPIAELLKR